MTYLPAVTPVRKLRSYTPRSRQAGRQERKQVVKVTIHEKFKGDDRHKTKYTKLKARKIEDTAVKEQVEVSIKTARFLQGVFCIM